MGRRTALPTISTFYGLVIQMFWKDLRHHTSMPCMASMKR
jgi:hypothetical protein